MHFIKTLYARATRIDFSKSHPVHDTSAIMLPVDILKNSWLEKYTSGALTKFK